MGNWLRAARLLALGIVLCALSACVASPVMVNRAIVRNATDGVIRDVTVRHAPTGGMGRASAIQARQELDLGFSRQALKARRAVVTWTTALGNERRVELPVPRGGPAGGGTLTLVYTIEPSGSVSVRLEP